MLSGEQLTGARHRDVFGRTAIVTMETVTLDEADGEFVKIGVARARKTLFIGRG